MNLKENLKFCENAKKGSGGRVWVGGGGRVLGVQMDKWGGGVESGRGVRVDVNEESKFL